MSNSNYTLTVEGFINGVGIFSRSPCPEEMLTRILEARRDAMDVVLRFTHVYKIARFTFAALPGQPNPSVDVNEQWTQLIPANTWRMYSSAAFAEMNESTVDHTVKAMLDNLVETNPQLRGREVQIEMVAPADEKLPVFNRPEFSIDLSRYTL